MIQLTQCCCWSTRYGSIIIAWIGIVFSASSLLAIAIALSEEKYMEILIEELERDLDHRFADGEITKYTYENTKFFYENLHHTILYVLAVGLIHHLICVVIHALLLCGVATRRYHMLLPWVIYGIFQLSVQFGYTIGFSVFLMTSGDIVFGLLNFFLSLAACATGFYFWLVVYSEFKDICMLTIQANNSC